MKKELTIAVAVKNDREDLLHCIDRIINQQGVSLQVLFVDAGSTDGSVEVLRSIAEADKRIEFYEIESINEADVRNRTLPLVHTPYVWFVNASSPIPPGSCKCLWSQIDEHNADIVAFPTKLGNWRPSELASFRPSKTPLTPEEKLTWFQKVPACYSPPTARIYRTSFLRACPENEFVTDNAFEGSIHNWISTILATRVVILSDYCYDQAKMSQLSLRGILGWTFHADIVQATRIVERFLKSDSRLSPYYETFRNSSEGAIRGHLNRFQEHLGELRRMTNAG